MKTRKWYTSGVYRISVFSNPQFKHVPLHFYLKESLHTLRLCIPIVIGEVIQMAVSLLSIALAGKISYRGLAAISLVNSIINIPFIIGVGITLSLLQNISAGTGEKNDWKIAHSFFNGFILISVLALLFALFFFCLAPCLFLLRQEKQVIILAIPYIQIMALALIPLLMFLTIKHFIDGLGDTHITLIFSIISMPLNIFFNWVLVLGKLGFPRLSLIGIGWSSIITNSVLAISMLLLIVYKRDYQKFILLYKAAWRISIKTMADLLKIGIPISLQLGIEISAFAVTALMAGRLGSVQQAAHQIVFSCMTFLLMTVLGLAQGNSIKISKAYGEQNMKKILVVTHTSIFIAILYSVLCGLIIYIYQNEIPVLFNSNSKVMGSASSLLGVGFLFLLCNNLQLVISSTLRGIRDVRIPTIYIFISYWGIGLPVGYMLLCFGMGIQGIWIGLCLGLIFSIFQLSIRLNKLIRISLPQIEYRDEH